MTEWVTVRVRREKLLALRLLAEVEGRPLADMLDRVLAGVLEGSPLGSALRHTVESVALRGGALLHDGSEWSRVTSHAERPPSGGPRISD